MELVPVAEEGDCPYPRSGHRLFADEGNIYSLGGYNPDMVDNDVQDVEVLNRRIFVELWRYNIFSRQWKEIAMTGTPPRFLASHTVSMHGKTLFTYGGTGIPFGVMSSRDVHTCTLEPGADSVHWTRLKVTGDRPEKKYGHCQIVQWPYLYIIGGTSGYIYNTDVHRLDLRTCHWTCLFDTHTDPYQQDPIGRYRHEIILHNDKMLMFGGGQVVIAFNLDTIPCFDLTSLEWQKVPTVPDPKLCAPEEERGMNDRWRQGVPLARKCHSCLQLDKSVYIFGGRNAYSILGDLWRLSLDTFQWTCMMPSTPSALKCFFHGATLTDGGCMYIFGGVTLAEGEAEVRTNELHRMWVVVPSLQELAWTVISRQRHLHAAGDPLLPAQLLYAGVPRAFIQRLLPR